MSGSRADCEGPTGWKVYCRENGARVKLIRHHLGAEIRNIRKVDVNSVFARGEICGDVIAILRASVIAKYVTSPGN